MKKDYVIIPVAFLAVTAVFWGLASQPLTLPAAGQFVAHEVHPAQTIPTLGWNPLEFKQPDAIAYEDFKTDRLVPASFDEARFTGRKVSEIADLSDGKQDEDTLIYVNNLSQKQPRPTIQLATN